MPDPIHIVRRTTVAAPPSAVWAIVAEPQRLPDWFPCVERAFVLAGEGLGRLQQVEGPWGSQRFTRHERVVVWEPPHRLAWEFVAEWLDGQPAPHYAAQTRLTLSLEPLPGGGCALAIESYQVPADEAWAQALGSRSDASAAFLDQAAQRLAVLCRAEPG
ncbi:MAG: SRPBCC family protein [Pirellulales bacterium]|nr:SRPBCC family protein [Pirellulales bacterium]